MDTGRGVLALQLESVCDITHIPKLKSRANGVWFLSYFWALLFATQAKNNLFPTCGHIVMDYTVSAFLCSGRHCPLPSRRYILTMLTAAGC